MTPDQQPISDIGLKDLAGQHLKAAIDRLGKLVGHEDARIALEASQLIIRFARPHSPGVNLGSIPSGEVPWGPQGGSPWGPQGGSPWGHRGPSEWWQDLWNRHRAG